MFDMKSMSKMLDPIIQPLIQKYEPDFKSFIAGIKNLSEKANRQEAFNASLNRDILALHEKINHLTGLIEDYLHARSNPGSDTTAGTGDSDDARAGTIAHTAGNAGSNTGAGT